MNKNNKKIIWITCAISVLLHLVMAPLIPNFEFSKYQKTQKPKTISLALVHTKNTKHKKSIKIQEPLPPKRKTQPKPIKKETLPPENKKVEKPPQKKEAKQTSTALPLAPSTSRKQKPDEKLSKLDGDRHKGALKGKKKSQNSKPTKPLNSRTNNTEKLIKQNKKSVTKNQKGTQAELGAPQPPSPLPQKKNTPVQKVVKFDAPQSIKKSKAKLKAPKPSDKYITDKNSSRISFAKLNSETTKQMKKSNPLFDAIKQAQPAVQISDIQLGGLQQLHDEGLDEARLGDPLSDFERKQRRVYNKYLAVMSEQVNEYWEEPKSNQLLLTRVRLYLTLEGYIRDVYIEQSSGHQVFDAQAIKAIKAVKQFHMPPSPAAAGYLTRLTMTVDNYSELDD